MANITLSGFTFSELALQLGSGTVQVTIKSFSANIDFRGHWSAGLHGDFTHVDLSQGELDVVLTVGAASGRPAVDISKLTLHFSIATDLPAVIKDAISVFLRTEGDRVIRRVVNSQLTTRLRELSMEVFLDPRNLTVMDVSLVQLVVDPTTGIVVDILGNSHVVGGPPCSVPFAPMVPDASPANVRLSVDAAVLQCAGQALQSSGALDDIANDKLPALLNLDGRLGLELSFKSFGPVTVSPQTGIAVGVDFDAIIISKIFAAERFITINTNVATSIEILASQTTVNNTQRLSVGGRLGNFTVGLNVTQIAADFPAPYAAQVASADFGALSAQAAGFLNGNVLPQLNNVLATGVVVPASLSTFTELLANPTFASFDGYFALEATVKTAQDFDQRDSSVITLPHV